MIQITIQILYVLIPLQIRVEGNTLLYPTAGAIFPSKIRNGFVRPKKTLTTRQDGFEISDLPKTFRDAIKVCRGLGVPYIWIDSLCIVQFGDNGVDWKCESQRMEHVFSSAYCTIAASSAANSDAGFLDRNISTDYVYAEHASGQRFYVCGDIDDFNNDAECTLLNTRAWVMQERVLSRRTIYFAANQVYFECGQKIYCENFVRLQSSYRNEFFILDPQFPSRLLKLGHKRTVEFIHFISEEYSRRHLSVWTDRCIAICNIRVGGPHCTRYKVPK